MERLLLAVYNPCAPKIAIEYLDCFPQKILKQLDFIKVYFDVYIILIFSENEYSKCTFSYSQQKKLKKMRTEKKKHRKKKDKWSVGKTKKISLS